MSRRWDYRQFVAKRLLLSELKNRSLSNRVVKLAIFGIILGIIIMQLSLSIITGYQQEVWDRVLGFNSEIIVESFGNSNSYDNRPIDREQPWREQVEALPQVESITTFASKPTIIIEAQEIHGAVVKGVDSKFNWNFFENFLVEGTTPKYNDSIKSNDILISQYIADILQLKVGSKVDLLFMDTDNSRPRTRRFLISGVYKTSLEELDQLIIVADIKHIIKINNWNGGSVGGFEINLTDKTDITETAGLISNLITNSLFNDESPLRVTDTQQKFAYIYNWLSLLDMNIWIILSLIIAVTGFNMISAILIIILKQTSLIGVMKALGASDKDLRAIFIHLAYYLIRKGVIWGNAVALIIMALQWHFHIVKLNPADYNLETVPINFSILNILLLNLGTVVIILVTLIIPTLYISKINPVKSIKFT